MTDTTDSLDPIQNIIDWDERASACFRLAGSVSGSNLAVAKRAAALGMKAMERANEWRRAFNASVKGSTND